MAASTQDVLEGIERRRAQLQESVDKLQKALTHWTTWEAEYETLKAELQQAQSPSPSQMRDIARDLNGALLTESEFEELLGQKRQTKRSANQVVDLISRRIDYVQQNSATIEKQLDAAEKQLAGVDVLLEPGMDNEEGLPMMDIEEELDEAGNEVASSVNQTGKSAAEIVEVLRKVGLQKAETDKKNALAVKEETVPASVVSETRPAAVVAENVKASAAAEGTEPTSEPAPKSVSSASDNEPRSTRKWSTLERDGYNEDLAAANFSSGTKVIELDENDEMIASYPIIPQGESPEDAELRRQMLQYGLSEVGQVVAELDLDRPTVSYSDDDMDEDYDEYDYNTTDDEEEDEYGRNTKPVLTEEYKKQMLELEQKLGARMMENVGPQTDEQPLAEHVSDVRTLRVQRDDAFDQTLESSSANVSQATKGEPTKKKDVRFAESVDVSEAPSPPVSKPAKSVQPTTPRAPTISDIVEKSASTSQPLQPTTEPSKPARVSKFKSARAASNQPPQMLPTPSVPEAPPVPTGPAGQTLANTITEHVPVAAEPHAPDEFDATLIQREVQADYHKARNRFIQQQGGFKPTEEDEERPIVEERGGQTKKVSRFMAARLKADGM